MSDAHKLDERQVKIVSISQPEKAPDGRAQNWAKVTFQIRDPGPEFFVLVDRLLVSDEKLIQVARHYLHVQMKQIVEATEAWLLSDAEYKAAVPPRITHPNRDLGSRLP